MNNSNDQFFKETMEQAKKLRDFAQCSDDEFQALRQAMLIAAKKLEYFATSFTNGANLAAMELDRNEWRKVSRLLFAALQGTNKRHRIALASAPGDDEPVFDPPAPIIVNNFRAVSEACNAFEKLNAPFEPSNDGTDAPRT